VILDLPRDHHINTIAEAVKEKLAAA